METLLHLKTCMTVLLGRCFLSHWKSWETGGKRNKSFRIYFQFCGEGRKRILLRKENLAAGYSYLPETEVLIATDQEKEDWIMGKRMKSSTPDQAKMTKTVQKMQLHQMNANT